MKINNRFRRVVEIDVGNPTMPSEEWETFVIKFHDFNNLSYNKWIESPKFTFCGVEFSLHLSRSSDSITEVTTLVLKCHSEDDDITSEVKFCVQGISCNIAYEKSGVFSFNKDESWRKSNGLWWLGTIPSFGGSGIPEVGTFSLPLMMRPVGGFVDTLLPKNEIAMDMNRLIWDTQFADVLFEVQEEETTSLDAGIVSEGKDDGIMGTAAKKGKETALSKKSIPADGFVKENPFGNQLYAHRLILQVRAPAFAMLCEPYPDMTPVPIPGVDFLTFDLALKYVYGVCIPYNYWQTHSKKLIDVADRFALTNLKMEAEAWFVKRTKITTSNAMDLLLYADAKNCPLLKEQVMKFFFSRTGWKQCEFYRLKTFPIRRVCLLTS
mmetsp:Transcript_18612/g.39030  ORF Transcript_18612/g.39030 Transcript_18612/m.39030 type:complete len:380 (+) Transcript_18612:267-1406(+)